MAPICVDEQGRNSIVIVTGMKKERHAGKDGLISVRERTGANDLLSEEEVIESTKVIASSSVLAAQLEIDPNVSLCALKIAREHGVSLLSAAKPEIQTHQLSAWTHTLRS